MKERILNPLLAVLVLGACFGEQKVDTPELADVMPVLPLPPDSRVAGRAGSEEALQLTFVSRHDQETIVTYYRETFTKAPWTLLSNSVTPDGAVIFYVENDGSPLWVRISPTPGAAGSTVQLSGALVGSDTTVIDSLPAPSDSQ